MIVYRFEKDGIGPYRRGLICFRKLDKPTRSEIVYSRLRNENLSLIDDLLYKKAWDKAHDKEKYIFGCSSKEKLRIYFRGDFKSLFANGYRVKRYKVPDDEVVDMGMEVAFPVRYHKLQTVRKVKEKIGN